MRVIIKGDDSGYMPSIKQFARNNNKSSYNSLSIQANPTIYNPKPTIFFNTCYFQTELNQSSFMIVRPLLPFSSIVKVVYLLKIITMPSTLYESVKASVVEYAQIKKMNTRQEDKMLFKWKLITIFLAILFIVLVGLFSQFLRNYTSLPGEQHDFSYVVPLIRKLNPQFVSTLSEVNNLVKGIAAGMQDSSQFMEYNTIQQLFASNTNPDIDYNALVGSIKGKEHLLFVFSPLLETTVRFGLYLHKGYSDASSQSGGEFVKDDSGTNNIMVGSRYSTIFNMVNGKSMVYNVDGCNLFGITNGNFTIVEALTLKAGATVFTVDSAKVQCYNANTQDEARSKLVELTGLSPDSWPITMTGFGLQVYRLSLDQSL